MKQDTRRTPRPDERPETTLRRLLDSLRDARRRAARLDDRRARTELTDLLDDAEALAQSLEPALRRGGSARDRDSRYEGDTMDGPAFRKLLETVTRYKFDSERTTLLKSAVKTASFTCEQSRQLLKTYEWDSERRRALSLLWTKLVDRRNVSSLADTFDWAAEWRSACRELGIE